MRRLIARHVVNRRRLWTKSRWITIAAIAHRKTCKQKFENKKMYVAPNISCVYSLPLVERWLNAFQSNSIWFRRNECEINLLKTILIRVQWISNDAVGEKRIGARGICGIAICHISPRVLLPPLRSIVCVFIKLISVAFCSANFCVNFILFNWCTGAHAYRRLTQNESSHYCRVLI